MSSPSRELLRLLALAGQQLQPAETLVLAGQALQFLQTHRRALHRGLIDEEARKHCVGGKDLPVQWADMVYPEPRLAPGRGTVVKAGLGWQP